MAFVAEVSEEASVGFAPSPHQPKGVRSSHLSQLLGSDRTADESVGFLYEPFWPTATGKKVCNQPPCRSALAHSRVGDAISGPAHCRPEGGRCSRQTINLSIALTVSLRLRDSRRG